MKIDKIHASQASNKRRLAIVIPLRAQVNCADWNGTCAALRRTLQSLIRQTSQQFDCMVVGHEPVDFTIKDTETANIFFATLTDNEPQTYLQSKSREHKQKVIDADKNGKILHGIELLRKRCLTYSHWFALDADDLVSKELVKVILAKNPKNGALLSGGYIWNTTIDKIRKKSNLERICGSTSILANKHIPTADSDLPQTPWFRYSHMNLVEFFSNELKSEYSRIRTPLICYVHHTDNSSDHHCIEQKRRSTQTLFGKAKTFILWSKRSKAFDQKFLGR